MSMEKDRIEVLSGKSRVSTVAGVIGVVAGIIGLFLGKGYSDEANREIETRKATNPEYQAMVRQQKEWERAQQEKERIDNQQRYLADRSVKEKQLEADRQRYILEQERLKVESENKKLSDIQEMNKDAMATLNQYENPTNLDDYGLIDAAYEIMDILKQEGINEQVKYRGLKRVSEFKNFTEKRSTDEKLDGIIAKIERL